jgi:hypothetical protein
MPEHVVSQHLSSYLCRIDVFPAQPTRSSAPGPGRRDKQVSVATSDLSALNFHSSAQYNLQLPGRPLDDMRDGPPTPFD